MHRGMNGRDGRHIDDATAAPRRTHPLHGLPQAQIRAAYVDCLHPVPGIQRHLEQRPHSNHGGIIDEDVDSTEEPLGLLEQIHDRGSRH